MKILKWILIIIFWPIAILYYLIKAYIKFAKNYQAKLKQKEITPILSENKNSNAKTNKIKSPKKIINDFVVIDFETTGFNPVNNQIIEIGAVKVINGEIESEFTTLVDPKTKISEKITSINGITNEMVKGKPCIDVAINDLIDFIGDYPIIAHNIKFDMEFLQANTDKELNNTVYCTLSICREKFNFKSNKLESACAELGITADGYHRALVDCICTSKLFLECQKRFEVQPYKLNKSNIKRKVNLNEITCTEPISNTNHIFFGKAIVFTGELKSTSRKDAMQKVVNLGAVLKNGVSAKVDYLILGIQDEKIVGDDGISSKQVKAYELQEKGHHIEILNEEKFLALLK